MSKRIAWLFPGQGAQYVGMGREFAQAFSIARETFEEADELLGEELSKIIFEGPEELLKQTRYSQLAIFVTSVALLRTLQQQMPDCKPAICAGLSLGEYTALFASNRISFEQGIHLVRERARLMHEACEKTRGGMAAVLGLDGAVIEEALSGIEEIWVANYNTPGQIVISGTEKGVEQATSALKAKGAKRVLPLAVHGAFHSGLMLSAQEGLAPFVAQAPFNEKTSIEFVMNVPGNFVETAEEIRKNLILQVTHSVRWHQGIQAIETKGADLYLEIGPGKTLTGMNQKIRTNAPTLSLEKVSDLDEIARQLDLLVKV